MGPGEAMRSRDDLRQLVRVRPWRVSRRWSVAPVVGRPHVERRPVEAPAVESRLRRKNEMSTPAPASNLVAWQNEGSKRALPQRPDLPRNLWRD